MIRGIYAAGAGMLAESIRNDVIANNLANANTAGYKKDIAVTKDFRSMLIQRINDGPKSPNIGSVGAGSLVDEVATIHSTGIMRPAGNPLDLAIEGRGFFVVETPNGERYTRNGSFSRNAQGELVTLDGYRVMSEGGPIQLGDASEINIGDDGRIMIREAGQGVGGDVETGRLRIVAFADEKQLVKEGSSLYAAGPGAVQEDSAALVRQGTLELSNVNIVAEMVNLISGYRAYETNAKAVQAHDQLLDKAVNEVGRV
jgi:flagellar basal-body rod protein FlgG